MRILVTGAWPEAKKYLEEIKNEGHDVIFMQNEDDELPCEANWVEGVIANGLFLHHKISVFESLKYIQLTSAGLDRVNLDYIRHKEITLHNAKGVYSIPVAEMAICGVLQLYKRTDYFKEKQREHIWEKNRSLMELHGKNVTILGCGSVGSECARVFKALGCKVRGIDKESGYAEVFEMIFPVSDIKNILPKTDILLITLPYTKKTHYLIGEKEIKEMPAHGVVVNMSRGGIVQTEALIKALREERLFGAVLDTFETEPLEGDSPLWDMKNVIITPHNSFVGEGNEERLHSLILHNLRSAGRL